MGGVINFWRIFDAELVKIRPWASTVSVDGLVSVWFGLYWSAWPRAFPFNKVNGLVTKQHRKMGEKYRETETTSERDHQSKLAQMVRGVVQKKGKNTKNLSVFACSIFTPHCVCLFFFFVFSLSSSLRHLKFPHYLCTSTNCGNFQDLFVAPQFPHF